MSKHQESSCLGSVLLAMVFLGLIFLTNSCEDNQPENLEHNIEEVEWTEINSPPGVDGRCYAYFMTDSSGYAGYGFSGVYCLPQ